MQQPPASDPKDHGPHTLRVWNGTIVGIHGDDVFVELGPRMQGVISARAFGPVPPAVGEEHEFTLRGQEESLWVLALREQRSLASWEAMEVGSWVGALVVRERAGGLELKVGPLHAFLPRSETGLPRERSPRALVGRKLTCEVIEVDRERQRIVLSRKRVERSERASEHLRQAGALRPGALVHGRVTRLEPYGAFVRFGAGLEGLVHVSDLAHRRVAHPAELLRRGDLVEAKVLAVRRGGKRIALGMKQLVPSPWPAWAARHAPGDLVRGTVTRAVAYGAFVQVAEGVEGLLHRSQTQLPPDVPVRRHLVPGRELSVRVLSVDPEAERLALSLLHEDGRSIGPHEAEAAQRFEERRAELSGAPTGRRLGPLLQRLFADPSRPPGKAGQPPPA